MNQNTPAEVNIFWRRFFAFLIDLVFMMFIGILLMLPLSLVSQKETQTTGLAIILVLILWLGVAFSYDMILTKLLGGTLGKKILKIKVVDLGQSPLSWERSAGRAFSRVLHMFLSNFIIKLLLEDKIMENLKLALDPLQLASHGAASVFLTISFLWILSILILYTGYYFYFFTQNRQTLHDLMAGTLVVRKR
ncbi:MAG: RDD family protein [Alphaproteobacteria bacterium]|nr:RDD family protein [Alphaproteobacteria bacterium]OJV47637.1 MAG: hypothetical protein BGO28_07355 [Alphaproteobacteria bacterium 43-37]